MRSAGAERVPAIPITASTVHYLFTRAGGQLEDGTDGGLPRDLGAIGGVK
jgi:hypothetical protein